MYGVRCEWCPLFPVAVQVPGSNELEVPSSLCDEITKPHSNLIQVPLYLRIDQCAGGCNNRAHGASNSSLDECWGTRAAEQYLSRKQVELCTVNWYRADSLSAAKLSR